MVNPVNGAVGLLTTGNWNLCQAAVETVLSGGVLQLIPGKGHGSCRVAKRNSPEESSEISHRNACMLQKLYARSREFEASDLTLSLSGGRSGGRWRKQKRQRDMAVLSSDSDEISEMTSSENGTGGGERKLLKLFV